jgi:glycerophosphoryl diester phosphodiesterase
MHSITHSIRSRPIVRLAAMSATFAITLAVSVSVAGGGTTGTTREGARPPVLVVAHRGASAEAPEHTGPAYDRAMWAGADVQECDLQLTADEQLVCLHDPTVDRTTGGSATGPVDSFTLAELRAMDFGSWFGPEFAGAKVVTLEEQIACYRGADPTMQFYIETKTQADQGDRMETRLVEVLDQLDAIPTGTRDVRTSPVIIQSFDAQSLTTVRSLAPSLPTALLVGALTPEIEAGQFPDVEVIAPNADILTARPDLVAAGHAAGLEVHTYTVDDPAEITALVDNGVDGFFTNDPATARTVVDQAGRGSGRKPIAVGSPAPSEPSALTTCPAGMGVGLNPLSAEVATDDTTDTSADPIGPESNEGIPAWILVMAIAAAVAIVVVIVVLVHRRSLDDSR